MDSYVNSVLELFNFVGYDDDGIYSTSTDFHHP